LDKMDLDKVDSGRDQRRAAAKAKVRKLRRPQRSRRNSRRHIPPNIRTAVSEQK
jgi:hypothetical protein